MPSHPLKVLTRPPTAQSGSGGHLVVMVHGAMDRATSFTRLMAKLRDCTILSYDRRGYAGSSHTGPPSSFEEQVEDLATVIAENGAGRQAIAFGHSFGADVVLAALAGVEKHDVFACFKAAVVWEPPQPWLPWWPAGTATRGAGSDLGPEDRAEWFMRRMVGDRVWERLPSSTRQRRRAEGHTLEAELGCLAGPSPFDPERIQVPVIVGRGGKSRPHQRRGAEELAAALPHGDLADIEDSDHGAHLSHPAEVAELIRRAARLAGAGFCPDE